jgi:hypothetical protein
MDSEELKAAQKTLFKVSAKVLRASLGAVGEGENSLKVMTAIDRSKKSHEKICAEFFSDEVEAVAVEISAGLVIAASYLHTAIKLMEKEEQQKNV